jgi:hypothetical protein
MRINIFAVQNKAKADIENIRGLNLAVVKLTTVQVNKLPLWHKIRKIGMICFAKPGLTENLYLEQKEEFSICPIRTLEQRPFFFIRDNPIFSRVQLKEISFPESQGACRQDELIGVKSPVVN